MSAWGFTGNVWTHGTGCNFCRAPSCCSSCGGFPGRDTSIEADSVSQASRERGDRLRGERTLCVWGLQAGGLWRQQGWPND